MTTSAFSISTSSSSASAPRQHASALARSLGFSDARAGQVALIASELATNIAKHVGAGNILVQSIAVDDEACIELLALDKGAGIPEKATRDGYSTAGSMGAGLGALQRLADQFEMFTVPEQGTVAVARVWKNATRRAAVRVSGISVAKSGETVAGDAWQYRTAAMRDTFLVVDGLGHGPSAAEAARAALQVFVQRPHLEPVDLVEEIHLALRATRGGAVAVALADRERELVRFVGVGNIAASLITRDGKRQGLASHNGTAGMAMRRLQEFTYPLRPNAVLVMHSDGLATHWNPEAYVGLWGRDPALVAGVLYRDLTRGRDDSTVVVARVADPA
jgi:anti-sigma regulatory factor (Ser/Thr protein kinase)